MIHLGFYGGKSLTGEFSLLSVSFLLVKGFLCLPFPQLSPSLTPPFSQCLSPSHSLSLSQSTSDLTSGSPLSFKSSSI